MSSDDAFEIGPPLSNRVGRHADAARIADAMVETWQAIDDALAPILGRQGVVALHARSLHLTAPLYGWLGGMHEAVGKTLDLPALHARFAAQEDVPAALGANALLQTFHRLLVSLVGLPLTERLLRDAWADTSTGPPARNIDT
jgi:DNA-binding GntR family transcriptional regulator